MVTFNASQFERRMIQVYATAVETIGEGDDVVLERSGDETPLARLVREGELPNGEALHAAGTGMLVNVLVADIELRTRQ